MGERGIADWDARETARSRSEVAMEGGPSALAVWAAVGLLTAPIYTHCYGQRGYDRSKKSKNIQDAQGCQCGQWGEDRGTKYPPGRPVGSANLRTVSVLWKLVSGGFMPASSWCRCPVVLMGSRRELRRVLVGDGSGRSSSPACEGGPMVRGCVWITMPKRGG